MPNTLTIVCTSTPSTEPVEFQNPNSPGVYVTGTQQANGTWQAIFTGVTKGAYNALATRLKNFPTITATIAASGPVLNIQQVAPAGTSASPNGANALSVTANSSINATAYRFLSASAQAGPYAVLVTQAGATYTHTGLTAGVVVWYEMQYVGGGFYDDSPASLPFSGTATAAAASVYPAEFFFMGDSKTSNPSGGGTSWAVQMALDATNFPAAGFTGTGHIIAVAGECADQQLARVPSQVIAARNATTYQQAIVWVTPGVNDLRIGDANSLHAGLYRTKYQIAHDILEMGRQARLNGMKPILMTFGPDRRQYQANPAEDSRMVALMIDVNNITTAAATKYGFVAVLDLTANAIIGAASSPINYSGTYWNTDLIHWNQTGEQYIAARASTLSQQVASTALTAFTDPGEYVVPTAPDTSTGPGVSNYTPYALVAPVFAEVVRAAISANSVNSQGFIGANSDYSTYYGVATSQYQAASTANAIIGYIDFILNDNAKEELQGWNNLNNSTTASDLVFAWHFISNPYAITANLNGGVGGIRPYGIGPGVGSTQPFIPYAVGDTLRVQLEQTRVVWFQNGIQRFTVPLTSAPIGYFLDMAIAPAGVLNDIRMGAANWIARPNVAAYVPVTNPATLRAPATFKAGVNVTVNANTVTKTAGSTTNNYDAFTTGNTGLGASGVPLVGALDFVANKNGGTVVIGFHAGNGIDSGVSSLISAGAVSIQVSNTATENGIRWFINGAAPTAYVPYAEGDRIKLEIQQSTINIYQNGTSIGTAAYALPANSPIHLALATLNTSITDVYLQASNPVAV